MKSDYDKDDDNYGKRAKLVKNKIKISPLRGEKNATLVGEDYAPKANNFDHAYN